MEELQSLMLQQTSTNLDGSNFVLDEDDSGNDPHQLEDEDEEIEEDIELADEDLVVEEEGEAAWRPSKILTFSAHAPIQAHTSTFSSREPTLPSMDTEVDSEPSGTPSPKNATSSRTTTSAAAAAAAVNDDYAVPMNEEADNSPSFATPSSNSSEESPMLKHHKRFLQLQAFLKVCDEADQNEMIQTLRSLSAAARSGHAFNLEYRALMLSIEEGREMLRLKMLNVMGGRGNDTPLQTPSKTTPSQEAGSTPVGSRLPAPGTVNDLNGAAA